MISYTVPAVLSYMIIVASVVLITISTRRFLEGEFKDILKWLLAGFWFMALPYTLFIIREIMSPSVNISISWAIYVCMVVVGLCILKAALLLDKFSRVYGFAEPTKPKNNIL